MRPFGGRCGSPTICQFALTTERGKEKPPPVDSHHGRAEFADMVPESRRAGVVATSGKISTTMLTTTPRRFSKTGPPDTGVWPFIADTRASCT